MVISALLIINTTLYVYLPEFSQKGRIMRPFNLARENNLAVWWSGISLFCAGLLAYELFSSSHRKLKLAWLALSFLFVGLASDELGSFHERIGSWRRLAPFGAIVLILLAFGLRQLFLSSETKKAAKLIAAGFLCFGLAAVQEKLEHSIDWPFWFRGVRVGIEEGIELLGVFFLLLAVVGQRVERRSPQTIGVVIGNPTKMHFLPFGLLLGAVVHLLVILFIVPRIHDHRGNIAALYPIFCYFILFCGFFWKYRDPESLYRKRWLTFALFALICSAGTAYEIRTNVFLIFGLQFLVFATISRGQLPMAFERARLPYVIAIPVLVCICMLLGGNLGVFVYGIFPYLLFLLYL